MPKLPRLFNLALSTADKLLERRRLLARPLRIHLEVNDFCNLHCIMCARRNPEIPKDRGELSLKVVEKLSPWFKYASYVGLAGNGEPFLHSRFFDILTLIINQGSVPSIVTNATLLQPEVVERLIQLGPSILVISIDGATKASFEQIRRGADFNKIMESLDYINRLKARRNGIFPVINFIICLMRQNVKELAGIVRLGAEKGAALVMAQAMYPYNPTMADSVINNSDDIAEPLQQARQLASELNVRFEYIPLGSGLNERRQGKSNSHRLYCEHIWQQLHVEVTGEVRYCCFWTEGETLKVLEHAPEAIWNSPGFQELRRRISQGYCPDSCKDCHMLRYHNPWEIISRSFREMKDILKG